MEGVVYPAGVGGNGVGINEYFVGLAWFSQSGFEAADFGKGVYLFGDKVCGAVCNSSSKHADAIGCAVVATTHELIIILSPEAVGHWETVAAKTIAGSSY